jgi:hypothetical protein
MKALIMSLALMCACEAPELERDCEAEGGGVIEGRVITDQVPGVIAADLTVRGVASHTEGRVIRRVLVAGIAAKNDGFNFDQWSVVVPIGVLGNLPDLPADGDQVSVEVVAFDGCEHEFDLDSFEVRIDRMPGSSVENLALEVVYPANGAYLPGDGSASATINITGNADARGAVVTMASNVGAFGGVAAGNAVALAGDGVTPAAGIVLLMLLATITGS